MERAKIVKNLIVLMLLCISTSVSAQVINFKTIAYAENQYNYYTEEWSGWSEWQPSDIPLTIDLQNDMVSIYSRVTQIYRIYKAEDSYYDSDGDLNAVFKFIDQDGDRGTMKLLQRTSGSSEIYIQFANVSWCYRVVRL